MIKLRNEVLFFLVVMVTWSRWSPSPRNKLRKYCEKNELEVTVLNESEERRNRERKVGKGVEESGKEIIGDERK